MRCRQQRLEAVRPRLPHHISGHVFICQVGLQGIFQDPCSSNIPCLKTELALALGAWSLCAPSQSMTLPCAKLSKARVSTRVKSQSCCMAKEAPCLSCLSCPDLQGEWPELSWPLPEEGILPRGTGHCPGPIWLTPWLPLLFAQIFSLRSSWPHPPLCPPPGHPLLSHPTLSTRAFPCFSFPSSLVLFLLTQ